MPPEKKTMNTQELTEAVSILLKAEERREEEEGKRRRRRARRRREEMEASVAQLTRSIEVIKWCIVGITSVMAVSLVILITVVIEVEKEAERIKGQVEEIKQEAEVIREKIRHPFESVGSLLGRQLENAMFGRSADDK